MIKSEGHELKVEHVSCALLDSLTPSDGFSKVMGHGFSEEMKEKINRQK